MQRHAVIILGTLLGLVLFSLPVSPPRSAVAAPVTCPLTVMPARAASVQISLPLLISLEWDTTGSPACAQWKAATERASAFLEGATGGRFALGPVRIEDNAHDWTTAGIQVLVQNTAVPDATVGGIDPAVVTALGGTPASTALSPTATISSGGVFARGAIHLGRSWSEFGPRRGRWSDPDGYRTIVHELGHYAFNLYDEYYGYSAGTRVAASCTSQLFNPAATVLNPLPDQTGASIMYWEYALHQFWGGTAASAPNCTQGRQWEVYGQTDWQVIAAHYPVTAPAGPAPTVPPQPACGTCNLPTFTHWQFNFTPYVRRQSNGICNLNRLLTLNGGICLSADGYLVQGTGTAVLHEGVPYLPIPPGTHRIPGAPGFYPPYVLEMLGAHAGDVARITLTDPADPSAVEQVALRLPSATGLVAPVPRVPDWYAEPRAAVPLLSVQPEITSGISGTAVSGLQVTATNPLPVPFAVAGEQGTIEARLFESGQGRQASSGLSLATALAGGHEAYRGVMALDPTDPILAGSLYVTPSEGERGHEEPATVTGGAWAMAAYSISCNSPTYFLIDHAPGDEGGIDSADGVINVHLPAGNDLPGLCVGFAAQTVPPPRGTLSVGQTYAVQGSSPLPAGTVITIHLDDDAMPAVAGGDTLAVVRTSLLTPRGTTGGPQTCTVVRGLSVDYAAGTVSLVTGGAGASYQPVLVTPAGAKSVAAC